MIVRLECAQVLRTWFPLAGLATVPVLLDAVQRWGGVAGPFGLDTSVATAMVLGLLPVVVIGCRTDEGLRPLLVNARAGGRSGPLALALMVAHAQAVLALALPAWLIGWVAVHGSLTLAPELHVAHLAAAVAWTPWAGALVVLRRDLGVLAYAIVVVLTVSVCAGLRLPHFRLLEFLAADASVSSLPVAASTVWVLTGLVVSWSSLARSAASNS